jgi:hypothetical protein
LGKHAFFAVTALALLAGACGTSASPTAPSAPAPAATGNTATLSPQVLAAVTGTWTGTTTPVGKGTSGHLSIVFQTSLPGTVAATLTWTSGTSATQYTGNATGTLDNFVVSGLGPQGACGYKASGTVTATTYAGTYTRTGVSCGADSGTFSTVKQ